jgi:hypothetical protein
MLYMQDNYENVRIQHLITIGAKNMLVSDGHGVPALDNLAIEGHPRWSQISIFDVPPGRIRGGDDEDGDGVDDDKVIWVDPAIWNSRNPEIWCMPPCTLVMPPWTKQTATFDYPRATYSSDDWTTTVTRRPLTVSSWTIEAITVTTSPRSVPTFLQTPTVTLGGTIGPIPTNPTTTATSSTTDIILGMIPPKIGSTKTWPTVKVTDKEGDEHSSRPTDPPGPPPPPPNIKPPDVTIRAGPPKPTVAKCFFPAIFCPPDNGKGGPPGSGGPPGAGGGEPGGEEEEEEEDEEDDEEMCLLGGPDEGGGGGGGGNGGGGGGQQPPKARPDQSKNQKFCYNSGHKINRGPITEGIEWFCDNMAGRHLDAGYFREESADGLFEDVILMSIEVKSGCEYTVDEGECNRYLRIPLDECNTSREGQKQGGTVENNCLKWRLDPNVKVYDKPDLPPRIPGPDVG